MQHCADGHGKVGSVRMLATVYGNEITAPTIVADCDRSGPMVSLHKHTDASC